MKKSRRWLLLLALVTFVLRVETLKATSLIFAGRNFSQPKLSTSESPLEEEEQTKGLAESNPPVEPTPTKAHRRLSLNYDPTDEYAANDAIRKSSENYTGNPNIDYIWDPNLPRELNGYNLSNYAFLDSVPPEDDIGFKCDDKRDGFYSSIKFSCQLYHHCLSGFRSDFICPNFTAFDQKTFICHFVNQVDCKNSAKYWNRNDALYIATTAATPKPTTTTSTEAPPPIKPYRHGPRRPPYRRRRPQVDYYYYEDDYESDMVDDRERIRRPMRPRNRRPEMDDYDSRRPYGTDNDRRRPYRDDFDDYDYDSRRINRERIRRPQQRPRINDERPRANDERRTVDDRRNVNYEGRNINDDRRSESTRRPAAHTNEERIRPKPLDSRRKNNDYDDLPPAKNEEPAIRKEHDQEEHKPTGSSSAGSIFERRIPPRINRPVPLDKRDKYAYNITEKPKANNFKRDQTSDDYYEEYDAPVVLSTSSTTTSTTTQKPVEKPNVRGNVRAENRNRNRNAPAVVYTTERESKLPEKVVESDPESEFYDDEEELEKPVEYETVKNIERPQQPAIINSRKKYVDQDDHRQSARNDQSDDRKVAEKLPPFRTYNDRISKLPSHQSDDEKQTKFAPKQTTPEPIVLTTTTTDRPRARNKFTNYNPYKYTNTNNANQHEKQSSPPQAAISEDMVEELRDLDAPQTRRPFLPSRGGNPYKARGLLPLGAAAISAQNIEVEKRSYFPNEENSASAKPIQAKTTLEQIYNDEFDVTLNDALNPTLREIPQVRAASDLKYSTLQTSTAASLEYEYYEEN